MRRRIRFFGRPGYAEMAEDLSVAVLCGSSLCSTRAVKCQAHLCRSCYSSEFSTVVKTLIYIPSLPSKG